MNRGHEESNPIERIIRSIRFHVSVAMCVMSGVGGCCADRTIGGAGGGDLVFVSGGNLILRDPPGADDAGGKPTVITIPGLWVKRHEVSVAEYLEFCRESNRPPAFTTLPSDDECPALVPHAEAAAYAKYYGGRLPTSLEVRWILSRRGSRSKYPWGEDGQGIPDHYGNVCGEECIGPEGYEDRSSVIQGYSDAHRGVAPVGSYEPDSFGIHDLGGNVSEWCSDRGEVVLSGSSRHVDRSEGWYVAGGDYRSSLAYLRCEYRTCFRGDEPYPVGFRIVFPVKAQPP